MTSCITGNKGFIGANLLRAHEIDTVGWDIEGCEIEQVFSSKSRPSVVFHMGAISSTTENKINRLAKFNIESSCTLLELCIENKIPFIYASSASVYGLGENGFKEDAVLSPINYYAISKASFDMFAQQKIKDNPRAKIVGLRFFNVYGKGEDNKGNMASPIYKFYDQAIKTGTINIFKGSEYYKRDFISIEDVVKLAIKSKNFKSGIYNIGTGRCRSFYEVAKIISKHTSAKIEEIPFPEHLVRKYQKYTKADTDKLLRQCKHNFLSLEEGIECFIRAQKQ